MEKMDTRCVFCIIRYGEISLKGLNRPFFEKKLVENIKLRLKIENIPFMDIIRKRGRILIYAEKYMCSKNVFGIASYSIALQSSLELEALKETIDLLLKGKEFNSFRITTKRLDKTSEESSYYNNLLGEYVQKKYNKKVKMNGYDLNINLEIIDGEGYLFLDTVKCIGGLPLGIEGKTFCMLNNEKDLLAAILMMKRGCDVIFLKHKNTKQFNHFMGILKKYHPNPKFINSAEEIEELIDINSVVTGQTLDDFKSLNLGLVEFRPLIGMTTEEINKKINELK